MRMASITVPTMRPTFAGLIDELRPPVRGVGLSSVVGRAEGGEEGEFGGDSELGKE